jgi:hypothetical protein
MAHRIGPFLTAALLGRSFVLLSAAFADVVELDGPADRCDIEKLTHREPSGGQRAVATTLQLDRSTETA